ncbi:nucleotide-binding domain containing protein [uncultured Roseobacter sp.]|uniref:nucleotide-binding domain containing protein n=1 Tax=uncultured Roseobacter sp. TaxID=114847 RepID=UPI0034527174
MAQAVAQERAAPAMMIGREIDPGVPVLTVGQSDPVALALKSGNFGTADFFAKALDVMETAS